MPRSLAIRSLAAAAREFLAVNDALLSATDHHGVTWEPVREKYGVRAEGWAAAFKSCVGRVGGAWSWAAVDMATLRACVPGLELPVWVHEAQASAAEVEWCRGMAELDGWQDEEQAAWYEYGGRESDSTAATDATWDAETLAGVLALCAEQEVDEEMIEAESTLAPSRLVCLAGGRQGGRAGAELARAALAAPPLTSAERAECQEIFGLEMEAPALPPLPAWAWR
jgi:hypothetical protein